MTGHEPAFPSSPAGCQPSDGISIRAYLAAKAMQAILTGTSGNLEMFAKMAGFSVEEGDGTLASTVAQLAIEYADALIAELNKGEKP